MNAVELFAGAGGLALGVSASGFRSLAVVEWDKWACDTIRENQRRGYPLVDDWPLSECDVRSFDWTSIPVGVDLLAGGPPCQPFSVGGKHGANDDERDMFPATVAIMRTLRPKAFIVENVRGLTRSNFANYYQYILLQLEFPEIPKRRGGSWPEHLSRLQVEKASGRLYGNTLTYNVVPTLVNAADYGVPQKRERVFIVGFRSDLGIEWSFPRQTHSEDALIHSQWVSGEYWERHKIANKNRPKAPPSLSDRIRAVNDTLPALLDTPWRTVRDALLGLPDAEAPSAIDFRDHRFQPGARVYPPGHTGSLLDQPAKTIKAGVHGVPGGENMLVRPDGSVRYFTVRETARLQDFPDGYVFHGSWTETMRQLGNAVPVSLARRVASTVAQKLIEAEFRTIARSRNCVRDVA
jgi:DNA (cytosine-5)-methyltransferase 1